MDGVVAGAFWLSLLGLAYVYVGYPVLLKLTRQSQRPLPDDAATTPRTTVIMAAHNEEDVIVEKARNVLGQLEAQDELIVVSDGSTDETDARVTDVGDARLRFFRQEPRRGKNAALNLGVREAHGEIVVFSDANALLTPGSLGRLLAPFADQSVGLVSGQGLYGAVDSTDVHAVSSAYTRYEATIRSGESALGFLAGVDGAFYAMRRELFEELPLDQVHDLLHPIQVALAGHRVVFVPEAVTVEPPSRDAASERRRQIRIIAQGFRLLAEALPRLIAAGRYKEAWMLVSHRLLRWTGWVLVVVALIANVALLDVHAVYPALLVCQALFFTLAAAGALAEHFSIRLRLLALPYYFCLVSYAGLAGLVEALHGRTFSVWAKQGSVP